MIASSELVLNKDGSVYHLKLLPEQIAHKIIIVGDPERVNIISGQFDSIEHKISNREFTTHTGNYNGVRLSVLSTGIGTDNIDIVLNELDALVNIDLQSRKIKEDHTSLELVRIGTCGSLQEDLDVDSAVFSSYSIGLDGLLHFYQKQNSANEKLLLAEFIKQTGWSTDLNQPYITECSPKLKNKLGDKYMKGITVTANGFYGPQGRVLRLPLRNKDFLENLRNFNYKEHRIMNLEMETSALFGLSKLLGHEACAICAIVANRYANKFSKNFQPTLNKIILDVLNGLTK